VGASLVRPHLDDIPVRPLPDGVEVRPVTEDQIRPILEAHWEAFRGEWDFREATDADHAESLAHPYRDESLWKVAWTGDTIVGQVKPFINTDENAARGYRRGYTEFISTHREWRNRGIAGALLAMSLQELKDRGMTSAALGVDTNNPGGAFHLYTSLGFEVRSYEAVYTRSAEFTSDT
jgi:ribosomal protein S18 acetylase RimI-like enzyme